MFELWIMVVGGESDDERIIAKGGFEEVENAIDEYESEVYPASESDKYFSLVEQKYGKEFSFECREQYYLGVKPELMEQFSLARLLGERLMK